MKKRVGFAQEGGGGGWGAQSASMDDSYSKEQEYIWLRGGALNGF